MQPEQFNEIFSDLVMPLMATVNAQPLSEKDIVKLYVDGPCGSGKTRMALELFRKLWQEKEMHGAERVACIRIDMAEDGEAVPEGLIDEVTVVGKFLGRLAAKCRRVRAATLDAGIGLLDLVNSVLKVNPQKEADKTFALVCHLDDFQADAFATLLLMRTIYMHNLNHPKRPILAICTGLYIPETIRKVECTPSGTFRRVYLPYFKSDGESYALMFNTLKTRARFISEALPAPVRDRHGKLIMPVGVSTPIKYLVEDTRGWAMACVRLGVALVPLADNRNALQDIHRLKMVEDDVDRVLSAIYKANIELLFNANPVGRRKILLLALAPQKVWWCWVSG